MSPVPNPRVVFAKLLGSALPVTGEHVVYDNTRTIDLENVKLNGGFLTKTLHLSPEPAIRERMRNPDIPSYTTALPLGANVVGFGLVVVLRSEKEGVKSGDYMFGMTPWEAYTVQPYVEGRVDFKPEDWQPHTFDMDSMQLQTVQNPGSAFPWSSYCSVLGTPGLTAYCGLEGLADVKKGDTLFVSSGASAVGVMVIQLAKAKGVKVIASAGSDAKVDYMKSLGADVVFNYKKTPYANALKEHGPISVYWDNVGGEALEAALEHSLLHARFVMCGSSSEYNIPVEERHPIRNTTLIFKKRLIIRGLLVPDLAPEFAGQFYQEIPALLAQGKIKSVEYVIGGLDNAPQLFVDILKDGGDKVGKAVIEVAKP